MSTASFISVESIEIKPPTASASASRTTTAIRGILGLSRNQSSSSIVLAVVASVPTNSSSSSSSSSVTCCCWQQAFSTEQLEKDLKLKSSTTTSSTRDEEVLQRLKSYLNINITTDNNKSDNKKPAVGEKDDSSNSNISTEWRLKGDVDRDDDDENNSSSGVLEIHVKKSNQKTGLVQKLWTPVPVLSRLSSSSSTSSAICFRLTTHLMDSLLAQRQQTNTLQSKLDTLERAEDGWKDTKRKLSRTSDWDEEKSRLVQNFGLLYKAKDDCIQDLQQQIQSLEDNVEYQQDLVHAANAAAEKAKEAAKTAELRAGAVGAGAGAHAKLDPCLEACPMDADQEYPKELIDEYARGPAAANKRRKKNKATGAIEYHNVDDAIQDLERESQGVVDISTASSSKPTASTTTGKRKKPASQNNKSETPSPVQDDDDDDDDDEDDDKTDDDDDEISVGKAEVLAMLEQNFPEKG